MPFSESSECQSTKNKQTNKKKRKTKEKKCTDKSEPFFNFILMMIFIVKLQNKIIR